VSTTVDRTRAPDAGPLPELELPDLRTFRLENGIRVWVAEDRSLPEVSVRLLVEAGALAEEGAEPGVAELTSRLLTEGTSGRSATEMAEWLDRLGASFSAWAGYDGALLSVRTLSETLDGALDFLRAAAREPTFPEEEVTRVRRELVDEMERDRDEASVVADHSLIRGVYGDHRYGTPSSGTPETVRSVGREDVAGFYDRAYSAADAAIVVCGDVEAEVLRDALEERFGDWDHGQGRPAVGDPPDAAADSGRVIVVDRPGSAQAELRLGTVGLTHHADDFYAAQVANSLLGGLFNSRVNMNLREDKGWTYGARTGFRARRAPGPFIGRTAVESGAAARALEEFMGEIRSLWERPPSEEEMRLARNASVLSMPRQFETVHQVSRKVSVQVAYDLPDDYWERYPERIESVTAPEVSELARKRIEPGRLASVVVARAEEVLPQLEERFGDVVVREFP
jgi:zinc protease